MRVPTRVRARVNASSAWVNTNRHESQTGLDNEKEKNIVKRKQMQPNLPGFRFLLKHKDPILRVEK